MEKLSEIVRSIGFYVREANFATVGDFWKDIVNFWKQHRFYYIKSGTAQIILKSASLNLTAGNLYYIPKNSVVTAINHEHCKEFDNFMRLDKWKITILNKIKESIQQQEDDLL